MKFLAALFLSVFFFSSVVDAYPPVNFPINWTAVDESYNQTRNLDSPYIGLCVCDETLGLCDPNCCCDPDCTEASKDYFTTCLLEQSGYSPIKMCTDKNFVTELVRVNMKDVVEIPGKGGAICIERINHPDLFKYYSVPTSVPTPTVTTFTPKPDYELQLGQYLDLLKYVDVNGNYVYRNAGVLSIPFQNSHGGCGVLGKPVAFMTPVDTMTCGMNGEQLCSRFPLSKYTNLFIDGATPAPVTVEVLDTSGNTIEVIPPTSTAFTTASRIEESICKNGIINMVTIVQYNATGVTQAMLYATVADVEVSRYTPMGHQVLFVAEGMGVPSTILSGTPGYLPGNHLRGGTEKKDGGKTAISERMNGFAVPSGGRSCNSFNFKSVRMYNNVISSGCFLTLTEEALTRLCSVGSESTIREILGGENLILDRIARTNDAMVNDTSSWVEVQGLAAADTPGTYDAVRRRCDNIANGVLYTIFTAKAGVVYNPQSVVVGAFANFTRGSLSIHNTTDYSATSSSPQHFYFKVMFEEVSDQQLLGKKVLPPPVLPRVGSDVFYPF